MIVFNVLLYYLIILPISVLPFFILYRISDILYFIFYYLVGYRKKVVRQNIERSFPDKSAKEVTSIMKGFYKHFADLLVESLAIFTISKKEALRRMKFKNPELLDKYFNEGRSVILAGGHYNNWELFAVAVDDSIKHATVALYKPLNNKYFDNKMRITRGKYGLKMRSIKEVKEIFKDINKEPTAIIFATDQSPSNPSKGYWMEFLNQDTPVLFGTEKYAVDYNCPVIYGTISKVKRGHYELVLQLITETPQLCKHGEITEMHTQLLEKDIRNEPKYWLWSHRRWKHKRVIQE